MHEFSAEPTFLVPANGNLTDDVVTNAREHPDAVALSRSTGDGWSEVTASGFLAEVQSAAKGLVAYGVEPGDRVALMSRTRYEWTLLDYAIWFAGAVTVPVYETSSPAQTEWILADSGSVLAITETEAHLATVCSRRDQLVNLRRTICLDTGGLEQLVADGGEVSDAQLEQRRTTALPDALATVIYTSGTTGSPKGCMLTHGTFMFELGVATQLLDELFDVDDASTLLFLPLAHVFARIVQVGCIKARVRLGHSGDIKSLVEDLGAFRPTFVLGIPSVFEKVFTAASQRAVADGRGKIFDSSVDTAIAFSLAHDRSGPGPLLRARHAVFDRLVYRRLRASLGGRAAYAVSGGAPLGEQLAHFFRGIGLPVLEGYGLTETTAALTVNLPGAQRIGSVGRLLPGTAVRVDADGELAFSGGQVFVGYWRDEEATQAALNADGWFRTGDIGEVDADGFVRITGRKKEILITAGGKNVAPTMLEDRIRSHPLVSQCLVVGDGRPFVAALVTIDTDTLPAWLARRGKSGTIRRLVGDPELLAEIQHVIDEANAAVSRAEAIRRFAILPVDWTEETGELTPTLKLKRNVVMQSFHQEIEALYR